MGRLPAGQLKERVVLLTPGPTQEDEQGGRTAIGPPTQTPVWARVRPLKATEKVTLEQTVQQEAYEITIRRHPAACANQRVTWNGKELNVQAVAADEDREYQLLTCFRHGG